MKSLQARVERLEVQFKSHANTATMTFEDAAGNLIYSYPISGTESVVFIEDLPD